MALEISDEMLAIFLPNILYWAFSGIYVVLEMFFENYKLHTKKEEEKNLVSKSEIVKGVLLQQAVHASAIFLLSKMGKGNDAEASIEQQPTSFPIIARQFIVAMIVLDTLQYFLHRLMHQNKFLYQTFHAYHHRIIVPYPYGAFYGNLSAIFLVSIGGVLTVLISGMSLRTSTYFFCLVTIKEVDNHCGLLFPGNPLQLFFWNNTAFHDIHHQLYGAKYNFSEPFFISWDKIMGTYMPYSVEKRDEGGFQVRPIRESKDD